MGQRVGRRRGKTTSEIIALKEKNIGSIEVRTMYPEALFSHLVLNTVCRYGDSRRSLIFAGVVFGCSGFC